MPTYQVTTDKGTYQVDTQGDNPTTQAPVDNQQSQNNVTNDLQSASSSLENISNPQQSQQPQENKPQGDLQDQIMQNIAQFGKNAYSVTPFAKRIAQLTGSNADDIYKQVGQPQGILQNISAMAGQMAPQIAMATPFIRGANVLLVGGKMAGAEITGAQNLIKSAIPTVTGKIAGGIVGSPMVRGALGLGSYSGAKTALMGGDGQEVTDATTQGIQQGLIYGALGKLGATLMPAKVLGKYAETAGSAVGGAIAGALTSTGGDNATAQAIFQGGLAALTPEEKFDFHKMVSNNVTQPQWENYLRKSLQISPEDTKTILDNGIDEIQRVGEMKQQVSNPTTGGNDTLGPVQMAKKFYQQGIQDIRGKLSQKFDEAIKANENNNPKDINSFVSGLKDQVDKYGDPTSPIVTRFNKTYNALQGFNPTTAEEEIPGTKEQPNSPANIRKVTMSELPKNIQRQVRQQLGQSGDIANLTLNSLHELKQNLYDAVSDKTWRDPGNTTPEERFAKSLGNQIGQYIGKNNELYQKASSEWSRMKSVESDIRGLNTNNLGRDWANLDPANKIDMNNTVDGISSYFKNKGVGEYDPKGLLNKYHAWNAISNPDATSFRNNAALKIAFQKGAAIMGGAVGLPFGGASGAGIGAAIGNLAAIHYMRPSSYIPILRNMKPNLNIPDSMNSQEALGVLKKLISKQENNK